MNKNSGFTLIELMVGLVVGLLVTGIAVALFVSSKNQYNQDEEISRLQENGRFAMVTMARDISMAGFLGDNQLLESIATSLTADSCSGAIGWSDFTTSPPLQYYNSDSLPSGIGNCFPSGPGAKVPLGNTSVLVIKRTAGKHEQATNHTNPKLVMRTNGLGGNFIITNATDTADWEYFVTIWFIAENEDGFPSLYRKRVVPAGTAVAIGNSEMIVSGIEDFGLEFGIDQASYDSFGNLLAGNDGIAERYVASTTIASSLLSATVSAKLNILARSQKRVPDYENDKQYDLGNKQISGSALTGGNKFYGRLFTTSVQIRNQALRIQLNNITL